METTKELPIDGLNDGPSPFISGIKLPVNNMPKNLSTILKEDSGIGGLISLLWFHRQIPAYASKFLEMCLIATVDKGFNDAVSHNTIICTMAGKDLLPCMISGLLARGDKFDNKLIDAAEEFSKAYDDGIIPRDFVKRTLGFSRKFVGIDYFDEGLDNPDQRTVILKEYVLKNFPSKPLTEYMLAVELFAESVDVHLKLNLEAVISVAFLDLFHHCGILPKKEAEEFIKTGAINGLFILGKSIACVGYFADQKKREKPEVPENEEDYY